MAQLTQPLLSWYPGHARDLPWRKNRQPYRVWLSEIMLQQTRVEAVKGYYQRFLETFPDIPALANAEQDQVNKCWEGLGYYSRAANLRKAAQVIVEQYGGAFPETWEEVRQLPGVGDYTAGAVCSICYDLPTPAVDGNVCVWRHASRTVSARSTARNKRQPSPGRWNRCTGTFPDSAAR